MNAASSPPEPQGRNSAGTGTAGSGTGSGVSVAAAAAALGIGERAVRKRIAAGTIAASQTAGGWVVYLDSEPSTEPGPEQGRHRGTGAAPALDQRDVRIAALEAELAAVREELRHRRAEAQQLIDALQQQAETMRAAAAAAIPASIIETGSNAYDAAQGPETARSATHPPIVGVNDLETPSGRRPWWRFRGR